MSLSTIMSSVFVNVSSEIFGNRHLRRLGWCTIRLPFPLVLNIFPSSSTFELRRCGLHKKAPFGLWNRADPPRAVAAHQQRIRGDSSAGCALPFLALPSIAKLSHLISVKLLLAPAWSVYSRCESGPPTLTCLPLRTSRRFRPACPSDDVVPFGLGLFLAFAVLRSGGGRSGPQVLPSVVILSTGSFPVPDEVGCSWI